MKTRVLGVLAALALGLSAIGVAGPAMADEPDGVAYVALGDSVASGNGIVPYIKDDEPQCLRSTRSYPMLLAKKLGMPVVTEACSGEGTAAVAGQLQELVAENAIGTSTRLVTLTVGVNDVQWGQGFAWPQTLIACSNAGVFPAGTCEPALFLSLQSLQSLPLRIAGLIQAIRAEAPNARIVVTGYAVLFGDFTGTCNVGLLDVPEAGIHTALSYNAVQAQEINQAVMAANQLIAAGVGLAADPGAGYVDVNFVPPGVAGFDGHGLCDTQDRWVSGVFPASAKPRDRGFHPNPPGQAAYANIIRSVLAG